MKTPSRLLSVREFAKLAGVTAATVLYHIKKKHIVKVRRTAYGLREDQLEVFKKFSRPMTKTDPRRAKRVH